MAANQIRLLVISYFGYFGNSNYQIDNRFRGVHPLILSLMFNMQIQLMIIDSHFCGVHPLRLSLMFNMQIQSILFLINQLAFLVKPSAL